MITLIRLFIFFSFLLYLVATVVDFYGRVPKPLVYQEMTHSGNYCGEGSE
jgi:hypothetical protein